MPINPATGLLERSFSYADDRDLGDAVTREDLDFGINEILEGVNAALQSRFFVVGEWSAATGAFPTTRPNGRPIKMHDAWVVSFPGTVDGVEFDETHWLVALTQGGGATYEGYWLRVPMITEAVALVEAATFAVTRSFLTDADEDDGRGPYELAFDPGGASHLQVHVNGEFLLPTDHFTVVAMETSASGVGLKFVDDLTMPTGHTVSYTLNRFLDPDLPPLPTVPENYGAAGDGTGDDSAAFIAALTAANGNLVVGMPGATYRITNTIEYEGPVRMDLSACTVIVAANVPAFSLSAPLGSMYALTGNYTAGDLDLDVATLPAAPAAGDVIWIASEALDPGNRDEGTNTAKYRCGEAAVVGIGSTTTNVILTAPLRMTRGINPTSGSGDEGEVNAYTTTYGARIVVPDADAACDLKLGKISYSTGHEADWDADAVALTGYRSPRVTGGQITRGYGSGIVLTGTHGATVDGTTATKLEDDTGGGQYGYFIADRGAYTRVIGAQAHDVRHAYTTSKGASSWPPASAAVLLGLGRAFGAIVDGGAASGGASTLWDTHACAEDVTFLNCRATGGGGAGFALRGKRVAVQSPLVRGCATGIYRFTEYSSGDPSDDLRNNGKAAEDWSSGSTTDADVEVTGDCLRVEAAFEATGGTGRWVTEGRRAILCTGAHVTMGGKQRFTVGDSGSEIALIDVLDAAASDLPVFDNPEVTIEGFVQIDATASAGLNYALQCESDDCRVTVTGHLHLILPSTITAILSTLGTIKTLGHGIITYEVVGAADNTIDLGLNGRSIRIVSSDGTVNTTPYKHVIRALSPFEFGVITYVDDTEVIRDCLEYATTNWLPVSFVGMQAICTQGDGEITFHCPLLDWAGVPFEGVDAMKDGEEFSFADYITAFVIEDPDCPLQEDVVDKGSDVGEIPEANLAYGSDYPMEGFWDGRGLAAVLSGGSKRYGGKKGAGSTFVGAGTSNYLQTFKISDNGLASHPLSTDLTGDTSVTIYRRADSERGQMVVENVVLDVSTFNNQCLFRIERNNVVLRGLSLIGDLPDYNRNRLIQVEGACDISCSNVIAFAMDQNLDPDENKSSRMFNFHLAAEVEVSDCRLEGGWGAIGSSDISGLYVDSSEINRVDVHGRGGNIFVNGCKLQGHGVWYGTGFGVLSVKNCTFYNTAAVINHRGDYPGGWYGGAWAVSNVIGYWEDYSAIIVDCWTDPIGTENWAEELPWLISVEGVKRLPRAAIGDAETAPAFDTATLTRAIAIRVDEDAVSVIAPTTLVVAGMYGSQDSRFCAVRLALDDLEPRDTGARLQVIISDVKATGEASGDSASTVILADAIKADPATGVQMDCSISNSNYVGVEGETGTGNIYDLQGCTVCRIKTGDEKVTITGGSLKSAVVVSPETAAPIGGAYVDEDVMTSLIGVHVVPGEWDLSQVGLLQGVVIQSGDTETILPDGVTRREAFRGWTPDWHGITQYARINSDYTLTSTTAAQRLFNRGAAGALMLAAGVYQFEGLIYVTGMSNIDGNATLSIVGAGTAVLQKVLQRADGRDANFPLAAGTISGAGSDTDSIAAPAVTTGTGTGLFCRWSGQFRLNDPGTIIPSIALTTPALATVKTGSYVAFTRVGDSSLELGVWS